MLCALLCGLVYILSNGRHRPFKPKRQESGPTPGFDYGEGGYDGVRRFAMDVRELDNCIAATSISLNLAETVGRKVETSLHFQDGFPKLDARTRFGPGAQA